MKKESDLAVITLGVRFIPPTTANDVRKLYVLLCCISSQLNKPHWRLIEQAVGGQAGIPAAVQLSSARGKVRNKANTSWNILLLTSGLMFSFVFTSCCDFFFQ